VQRAGFIAVWILGGIAQQVNRDARAGALNAKSLWRYWMTEYWPRVPAPVRAPFFAVGVAGRAVYRAGHQAGRSVYIGARNGIEEGQHRYQESVELREYPRGSEGYVHVLGHIEANRRVRADMYREQGEQVHGAVVQRREEKNQWARAATLADLGAVTARWAEGGIKYHPGGYDKGPAEETLEIVPALAALNRSGFVTSGSQPGWWGPNGWGGYVHQRAAVDGFTDSVTADQLEATCQEAGLIFIRNGPAGWRTTWKNSVPVTANPIDCPNNRIGEADPFIPLTEFGTHLSRRQVKFIFDGYGTDALLEAEQVTIIDPEWGRRDYMWQTLVGDAHVPVADADSKGEAPTTGGIPQLTSEPANWLNAEDLQPGQRILVGPDNVQTVTHPTEHDDYGGVSIFTDKSTILTQLPAPVKAFGKPPPYPLDDDGFPLDHRTYQIKTTGSEWEPVYDWVCGKSGCYNGVHDYGTRDESESAAAEHERQHGFIRDENNGGSAMTAPATSPTPTSSPTTAGGGDITTIPALERAYDTAVPAMATAKDVQSSAAADYRAQAASLEAAAAQIAADGHDEATVTETYAAMSAMLDAAARADEAAAAADAALASINAAKTGIRRHDALREAVNSHAGHAHTDAFREG
jgi:hypothetical protein